MEKTRTYFLIRFTPDPRDYSYYGDKPRFVYNINPQAYRARWSTTSDRHRVTEFSNLARAKQVSKAVGLRDEREGMTMDIVKVQEYREMHSVFPEPNVVEQLAQIESEA